MKHLVTLRRWMIALLVLTLVLPVLPVVPVDGAAAASTTYRALLIGNNAYVQNPLRGCINDAKALKLALESSTKLNYAKRSLVTDLKGADLEKAFTQLGGWGIGSGDVTLVYYSGHGYRDAATGDTGIVGTDLKKVSFSTIEKALNKINGTIVLLLDSCHSGGAVGKSSSSKAAAAEMKQYNLGVTQAFAGSASVNAKAMTGSKFHVITAASTKQYSYESGGHGYFTTGLTEALGWNCVTNKQIGSLPGDADADGKVGVGEAYRYARDVVNDFRSEGDQDVQVSPANSTLTLVQRAATSSGTGAVEEEGASLSGLPNPSAAVLAPGQSLQMNNAQSLSWSSSKSAVASVSADGLVSAKKNGKAQLIGRKGGKVVVRCNLDVVSLSKVVRSIGVSESSLSEHAGRSLKLSARVNPSGALKKGVKWYSSDKSVAAVSGNGVVKLKKEGIAKIYCIASSGLSDVCVVNVTPALVTRVAMKSPKASVRAGKKLQLQAKALPNKAGNRKVQWASTNASIVEVDPDTGIASGVAPGRAYVTATATDGSFKSAKCLVYVLPAK